MNIKAYWDGSVCWLTLNGKQFPKAVAYAMWQMNAREWLNDRPTVSDYEGEISRQTYEEFCSLLKKVRAAFTDCGIRRPGLEAGTAGIF